MENSNLENIASEETTKRSVETWEEEVCLTSGLPSPWRSDAEKCASASLGGEKLWSSPAKPSADLFNSSSTDELIIYSDSPLAEVSA